MLVPILHRYASGYNDQSPTLPRSNLYLMNLAVKNTSHSTVTSSRSLMMTTAGMEVGSLLDRKDVSLTCVAGDRAGGART